MSISSPECLQGEGLSGFRSASLLRLPVPTLAISSEKPQPTQFNRSSVS